MREEDKRVIQLAQKYKNERNINKLVQLGSQITSQLNMTNENIRSAKQSIIDEQTRLLEFKSKQTAYITELTLYQNNYRNILNEINKNLENLKVKRKREKKEKKKKIIIKQQPNDFEFIIPSEIEHKVKEYEEFIKKAKRINQHESIL